MVEPMPGEADTQTILLERLQRALRSGRLEQVELEYWTGGGPPPPYYRSDQFRLMTLEAHLVMEFARPAAGAKQLTEKFRRLARPDEVRELAGMIDTLGVFRTRFEEEERPAGWDLLSTEILLRDGDAKLKRVYWQRVPRALDAIRLRVGTWTAELIASGEHGLFNRGQPVSVDRPSTTILLGVPPPGP